MKYVLGFDIGGTKSAILLARPGKENVEFLERKAIPTHGTWKEVLGCLADKGKAFLESHQISGKECCIGISCGGPLDSERGVILSPPNLPGWDQVPIVSYLEQRLDMDARLKNDADACALAEWRYGAGRGCRHMIFLTFGTGLGAGLVLNGRL
ncbi:ROK family protein, partial [Enterocloster sp.]